MEVAIERAKKEDMSAILEILKHYNMHHIPSEEMPSLDYSKCFIAKIEGKIIGVGGYKMLSNTQGKTTVLAVHPDHRGKDIGKALQLRRMKEMISLGAKKIITNADRPRSIEWYKRNFGYVEVGTLKKMHSFGHPDIDHWTTLELDIEKWRSRNDK